MADKIAKIKGCEVQDFDLAEAQSGQASAVTDTTSVMVKTSGGGFIEIPRDELVKAFATVMASNNQTTFNKLLGVAANGTPMGIEANNLASVLGGLLEQSGSDNLNNNITPGVYTMGSSSTNKPLSNGYGCYMVLRQNTDRIWQIAFIYSDVSAYSIYVRAFLGSWLGWKQVTLT